VIFLVGCTPDEENYGIRQVSESNVPENTGDKLIAVIHEGNFQWGNASASLIDLDSNKTYNGVFNAANNELLGDVGQSIYISGDTGWIVVNNSGKIEMVELPSFKRIRQISGFISPRYIDCEGQFCYVTDIYGNKIYTLSRESGDLLRTMPLSGWSEEVRAIHNKLFISYLDSVVTSEVSKLICMNQETGQVLDTIFSQIRTSDLRESFGYVVENSGLYRLNYLTETKELLNNNLPKDCSHLSVANNQTAFFISDNQLYRLNWISENEPSAIFSLEGYRPYNLEVDSKGEFVYVVDVRDYTSNGRILQISDQGNLIDVFEVGVLPNDLAFLHP
jgi:hypothetical protein